jgi:hypothetical protein
LKLWNISIFSRKTAKEREDVHSQKALAENFNQSATDAREAFPEKLDNLVIVSKSMNKPVYISPAIAGHLSMHLLAVKKAVKERVDFLNKNKCSGVANHYYDIANLDVKLISINEDVNSAYSSGYTKEMRSMFTLDHEIGHLVVKNGYGGVYNENLAECAADAYAALRHVQQFGMHTDVFERNNGAFYVVIGKSPVHYTDRAIQKVRQIAQETDITRLSLAETAALAEKIANETHLDAERLHEIKNAFRPVAELAQNFGTNVDREGKSLIYKETISVMRANRDDASILEAGKQFLNSPSRKQFMTELAKTEPYWQEALDFIAQPEAKSSASVNTNAPPRNRTL